MALAGPPELLVQCPPGVHRPCVLRVRRPSSGLGLEVADPLCCLAHAVRLRIECVVAYDAHRAAARGLRATVLG
ncbi:hypothetical protein AFB00_05435 [Pseudonocardia sp. HH130630-07]|nr:hypothetical protein AFB00_05435 [Pseudonocardia sp. HH130630-07]